MYRILKYLFVSILALIMVVIGVGVTVLVQRVDPAQQPPEFHSHHFADTLGQKSFNLDSLKNTIGANNGLPIGFEVAAAIAYSAYPQLKDINIDMVLTEHGPPMMADIDIWSMLGPRKYRRYIIKLNDSRNTHFDPILLRSLPFDAQVGILAHELGHIAYYHRLSAFEMAKWGWCYLINDEFHVVHERTTDLMPFYHGLGSQIYQYAYYVRNDPSCSELYQKGKGFIDKYYMTDSELLLEINKNY